jgi:hypothetical protein
MRWICALIVALCLPSSAWADEVPGSGVSSLEVAAALKNAGYPADITADQSGDPLVRSSTGRVLFNVYFYQCGSRLRCQSIQFTAPYRRTGVPPATIAAWNRDRRFGRAFLDSRANVWIAMDVEASRGITTEALEANVERWVTVMNAFETFIAG